MEQPTTETPEILALAKELAADPTNYPRWVKPGIYYASLESRIAAALSSSPSKD
jgi:hypothetical protein